MKQTLKNYILILLLNMITKFMNHETRGGKLFSKAISDYLQFLINNRKEATNEVM